MLEGMSVESMRAPVADGAARLRDEIRMIEVPGGQVWMRQTGAADGCPLILVHGGPGSPHDYLEPLAALGDRRPLVFYDQLGCGRSEQPDDPSLWVLDRFVAELDAVFASIGCAQAHMLGHSWGAMLAVDYALANPKRVASLILSSPCLSMDRVRADMDRLKAALPESVKRVIARCEEEGTTCSGAYGAAAMAFYRRHVCAMTEWPEPLVRSQTGWNKQVYTTMWGAAEFTPNGNLAGYEREMRLGELRMPVLYLCGRHDEMTPETTAVFRDLTADSELVVFERSAHVAHLEEPALYLETVHGFLDRAERR